MKSVVKYFYLFLLCGIMAGCKPPDEQIVDVIDAPLPGIVIAPEKRIIDAGKPQRVFFSDGFSVTVPENAFVDQKGNPVEGEVELLLKTYESTADILASGIPMHYRGEDEEGMFQSAGMFEITASAGGTELTLAQGKSLDVVFPTAVKGHYDFFQFVKSGDQRGKWIREVESPDKSYTELPGTENDFRLQWNVGKFPGLVPFDTVLWQLATPHRDPTAKENKWVLETKWDAFRVSKPTHGFKDPIISQAHSRMLDDYTGMHLYMDTGGTVFSTEKSILFYNNEGKKISEFKLKDGDEKVSYFWTEGEFVRVVTSKGSYLLKDNGSLATFFEDEFISDVHQDGNRVLTLLEDSFDTFYLTDLKGEVLEVIKKNNSTPSYIVNGSIYTHVFFTDDYLIHLEEDKLEVLDLDGRLLYVVEGPFLDIDFLTGNQLLLIRPQQVSALDLETRAEKQNEVNNIDFQDTTIYGTGYSVTRKVVATSIPKYNSVLFTGLDGDNNNSIIWHLDENKIEDLGFRRVTIWNDNQRLVLGLNYQDSTINIYDAKLKKRFYRGRINDLTWVATKDEFDGIFWSQFDNVPPNALWVNEEQNRVFLNVGDQVKLMTLSGDLVFDFYEYDSLITDAGALNDEWIGTYSADGVYELWNLNGEKVQSSLISSDFESDITFSSGPLISRSTIPSLTWVFDHSGNLETDLGNTFLENIGRSDLKVLSDDRNAHLVEPFELPEGALQLTLIKGKKEFITYIYLTEGVGALVNTYQDEYLEEVNQERKRQDEERSFRRKFSIGVMGLYNCDIVLRVPEALIFAANFQIDGVALPEGTRIFDLMESDGFVVGEVTNADWKKFPIDPRQRHRFVAILPQNQLAMLDFKDFEKIDWGKVRQEGMHTFDIKKVEGSFESLGDLDALFSKKNP